MSVIIKNIKEQFNNIEEYWKPYDAIEFNNMVMKMVKLKGEYEWHKHEFEEKLFFVVEGKLLLETHEKTYEVNAGEVIKVPKNTPHKPYAPVKANVIFLEPIKHEDDTAE